MLKEGAGEEIFRLSKTVIKILTKKYASEDRISFAFSDKGIKNETRIQFLYGRS